jgi:hypothetical protein
MLPIGIIRREGINVFVLITAIMLSPRSRVSAIWKLDIGVHRPDLAGWGPWFRRRAPTRTPDALQSVMNDLLRELKIANFPENIPWQ